MDSDFLARTVADSASAVYEYMESMQFATDPPMGVSSTGVSSWTVGGGYAVLQLESVLQDTSGLMLMLDSLVLDEESAGFTRYDEVSRTIVVRPGEDVLRMLGEGSPKVSVLSDMKFLVSAVREFYTRYGGMLGLPSADPVAADPVFPGGSDPSDEQRAAVSCVLSSRMSYIWGAPGTGKTQYVLATCIRACLDAGRRVAVFAPTNNSVEQVLRGIISAFGGDREVCSGIIRLGVPTRGFLAEHPEMCEDRQAQRRMELCLRTADNIDEVMMERCCDVLEWEVLELQRDAARMPADSEGAVMLRDNPDLMSRFRGLAGLFAMVPGARDIAAGVVRRDFRDVMADLVHAIYGRERPASDLEEFEAWSDAELIAESIELRGEAERLRAKGTEDRLQRARIIASTPQQFISRFRPRGSDEDSRMELDVDHIFLDEAGYCGLVQALSLFTNGVPVTFLGDHMQLPPVSQLDEEAVRIGAERGGRLRDAFLWCLPALECEGLLTLGPDAMRSRYLGSSPPLMDLTSRRDLTDSHRFGANLASVLDRHIYRNGMTGSSAGGDLVIQCIDVVCDHRDGRENRAEAEAVRAFLDACRPDPGSVAVLTPYTVQLRMLRRMVGRRYRDSVMTVHGSQGREWDTVVFSVADNGIASRDVPLRFTSSETEIGRRVVNTAVSRARRRLVLVCDRRFWSEREGEFLGGLLAEAVPWEGSLVEPEGAEDLPEGLLDVGHVVPHVRELRAYGPVVVLE